ncbi:MAG TPA: nucleotidyltransferase family protein, partial [Vicinamibacteria bacterium]
MSTLPEVETALLRKLVRAGAGGEAIPSLPETIDWALLVAAAERHRLAPLVFEGLSRFPSTPPGARARLENIRNLEIAKAVIRMHHVDELGGVALQERLDLHLLKGAAFATTLYRDPGLRPMCDIDVLASPAAFAPWSRELEKLGYTLVDVSDHASCYRRRATGVLVELHRALTSAAGFLRLDTGSLFERSRPLEGGLRTLSWEDHLLHLSLHASFQHGFRQAGINAWEACAIAEREDFDSASFLERARAPRLAPWVYGGLVMAGAVFDGTQLASIRQALEDGLPRSMARKARRFQAESLLGPSPDAISGSPTGRLLWNGFHLTTISLLWEISRPRPGKARQDFGARPRRIMQLLRNHGFTLSSSKSATWIAHSHGP